MTHTAQLIRLGSALLLGWTIAIGASSPAAAQCVGDCDNDNTVRIPEVQRCVNIRTGAQSISACQNADQNRDGNVSTSEVDACIASFLDAATCPRVATPAATNTVAPPTSTATVAAPTATNTLVPTATRTNTPVPTNTVPPTNSPTTGPTNTPPVRLCAFNGANASDNSTLQVCFLGVCPTAIDISGSVEIACDSTQGGNGQRACQCKLVNLNPFPLTGVGTICVEPSTAPCPAGRVDCDGGTALNLDTISDTDIGTCSGNSDCSAKCATHCSGLGYEVYNAACESFCQGGTRADQACICDSFNGTTCTGGQQGVNDCPGGSCEGKDNEADTDCHCACLNTGFGAVSPAGTLQCRVGVAIRVEADPVCDNNQVLVRLPPQCAPFGSASASARILETNEGTTAFGPFTDTGVSGTCAELDSASVAGYTIVSDLAFLDSTIGDLISRLKIDCQ